MSDAPSSFMDLQFLPDWARDPSPKTPVSRPENRTAPSDKRRDSRRPSHVKTSARPTRSGSHERRDARHAPRNAHPPRPPEPSFIDIEIAFLPEPHALRSVGEQVRASGLAYPLFSLAKMFLDKPERHLLRFRTRAPKTQTPLFQCGLCKRIALNESAIAAHALKAHGDLFYAEERIPMEAPKGNFTSVARCDLNGALLGPTNHHAYQSHLMRLYQSQFRHLSFDRFKASVTSIHDPEIVQKWKEQASWKTVYKCLQTPEPLTLPSTDELERHFRAHHFQAIAQRGHEFTIEGSLGRQLDDSRLVSSVRNAWEEESRFPLNLANRLREEFFKMELHIFKGKKGMQFASTARPKPLQADEANVSKTVWSILEFIKTHPGCDRKALLEALGGSTPNPPEAAPPSALQDLHWLTRQGHVIAYHNGALELARSPSPPKKAAPNPPPSSDPAAVSNAP